MPSVTPFSLIESIELAFMAGYKQAVALEQGVLKIQRVVDLLGNKASLHISMECAEGPTQPVAFCTIGKTAPSRGAIAAFQGEVVALEASRTHPLFMLIHSAEDAAHEVQRCVACLMATLPQKAEKSQKSNKKQK